MKTLTVFLSLIVATNASAARIDAPRGRSLQPVESERKANALRDGRAVFTLSDGSVWITHSVPARVEPSPIGVTRFGRDGSERVFLLSDWLPKGTIPGGWCGQVYGVALLDDGRVAVSGGWNDGADSHNAILVLRARPDGAYDTDRVFEWPGLFRIVGGPRNTILAVTHDPTLKDGGPIVTLFDAEGHRLGSCCGGDFRSIAEAARNAGDARLLRVAERRFALYDRQSERVLIWDLDREGPHGSVWTPVTMIFVGDDASVAELPVIDIAAAGPREMLVARTGLIRGSYGTQLTVYGYDPGVKDAVVTEHPWRFLLAEKNRLRGVVMRGQPHFDTVDFRSGSK